jgi:hypothetical protein
MHFPGNSGCAELKATLFLAVSKAHAPKTGTNAHHILIPS